VSVAVAAVSLTGFDDVAVVVTVLEASSSPQPPTAAAVASINTKGRLAKAPNARLGN
jgi:hypothetical protein